MCRAGPIHRALLRESQGLKLKPQGRHSSFHSLFPYAPTNRNELFISVDICQEPLLLALRHSVSLSSSLQSNKAKGRSLLICASASTGCVIQVHDEQPAAKSDPDWARPWLAPSGPPSESFLKESEMGHVKTLEDISWGERI